MSARVTHAGRCRPAPRGALAVAALAARRSAVALVRSPDHRAPLRRRPVGLPAVGADRRAGGAARPAAKRRRRRALLLIGIEGGDAGDARADASRRLAAALRRAAASSRSTTATTARFAASGRFLFEHRYLLSPAVEPRASRSTGLRAAIDDTRRAARHAGRRADQADPAARPDRRDGAHRRGADAGAARRGARTASGSRASAPRAVLVATTRGRRRRPRRPAAGAATRSATRSRAAQRAGATSRPKRAALELSGAGMFGVASRARIKAEVERLAICGRRDRRRAAAGSPSRSLRALAVALLPVATGVLAGIAAVSVGFGQVHGMTLGFGTTLIGEAVDYAIYYLIQAPPRTPRRRAPASPMPGAGCARAGRRCGSAC